MILADSNDAVWLPCGRDLRAAFRSFQADVVLGGNSFLYPDKFKEPLFPENLKIFEPDNAFDKETKARYMRAKFINAGVITGYVGALLHYFGGEFIRGGHIDNTGFDDQRCVSRGKPSKQD